MLKLFDPRWFLFVMLLTVAALPVRTHASTPTVVISEIAWAGSSISSSDEWIELSNAGDTAVDLSGWKLTGAGSSGADLVLPDGAQIEPHSSYVIANYEHTHANSALESAPSYVTATLSLSNSGFTLSLYDAGNAQIDVAGGSGAPFAGGSGSTGDSPDGRYASMVRVDGLSDGSLVESWTNADTSLGFKAGVEDLGTPGVVTLKDEPLDPSVPSVPSDPSAQPDEEEPTAQTATTTIRISEFVADQNEGDSEWVELVNAGNESVDLTGWNLEDAAGKQTPLASVLEAGAYLVIESPVGKLNNDTDSILLKDTTGVLVDSVEYGTDELEAPKDGTSMARGTSGSFELTYTTTPGEVNVIDQEKPEETKDDESSDPLVPSVVSDLSVQLDEAEPTHETATIHISEFVIDPSGDGVEWIELFNAGMTNVTLEGWTIEDASGKATDLYGMTIEADSYAVIESPKGKLNNDADSVILKDASGAIVESVVYGGDGYPVPKDGEALALNRETFEITELTTPGDSNLIFVALEEIEVDVIPSTDASVKIEESLTEASPSSEDSSVDEELLLADTATISNGQNTNDTEEVTLIKTARFVSLYPNASGSDEEEEYVTIENSGSVAIDLLGWFIEDGSTKKFTFKDSTSLAAGATIQISRPQSKLTLNNGGDTLELIAPDGEVVDLVTYGNSAKGATYDLVNGTWMWSGTATVAESTTIEPAVNESVATDTEPATTPVVTAVTHATNSTNSTYASANTTSTRIAQLVTIAQAKTKADGQNIIVKGIVTSAPETFGSQIFYLQDDTGGIQVYLHNGDFPELAVGDVVRVTGELSTNHGERRVKLASAAGAMSASGTFASQPIELAVSDVDESIVGLFIQTQGLIQSIDTNKLVIEHLGATLTIFLKSNPLIDAQQFERGDKIKVTGVLTSYDGELRLRPRSTNDISIVEQAVVTSAVVTPSSGDSSAGLILLTTTMAALVALALWRYLPRRRLTPAAA